MLEAVPLFLDRQGLDFFQNAVGVLIDIVFAVLAAKEGLPSFDGHFVGLSVISFGLGKSEAKAVREITACRPCPAIVAQSSAAHQSVSQGGSSVSARVTWRRRFSLPM